MATDHKQEEHAQRRGGRMKKAETTVWDIDSTEEGAGMSTEKSFKWT